MKKIICMLLLVVMLATMLTACKFTCDVCEEEKDGKKQTAEIDGKKITYCEDCEGWVELAKAGEEMAEALGG